MTAFEHRYDTPTDYRVWETENARYINPAQYQPYLDWIATGGVPAVVSGDRFVLIIDGVPQWDPNKDLILAQEVYAAAHPPAAMDETLRYLCDVVDEVIKANTKGAPFYDYLRLRWYTRDVSAADIAIYVQKRVLTQAEADTIMATEQVPA